MAYYFCVFHDVVSVGREQHALQSLALVVVSARVLCAAAHSRVYAAQLFCLIFGKNFNIMSAFLSTNRSPCRKKSILAEVCFGAKRG